MKTEIARKKLWVAVLRIEFNHSGHTYDFANVEPRQHQALVKSESIGKHFALHIQPHHKSTRITK